MLPYMDIVVDCAPEKKVTKLVMDILKRVPVIHVFCNTKLTCLEFLRAQLPPWSLSAQFLREARKDAAAVNRAYLASVDDALSRFFLLKALDEYSHRFKDLGL